MSELTAWSDTGGESFRAVSDTIQTLPAGLYKTYATQTGFYFDRHDVSDLDVLRFPGLPIDRVLTELEDFWSKGELFEAHGIPHKRGYLLYGPPGSGKTCTLQLIVRDVIARDGLVFDFSNYFSSAYNILREVEPERPLVVVMEDLDSIITPNNESGILQILDGIGRMHKTVFVATTNYPERLQERITNRPSRFDRKVFVDHPSADARRMYVESLLRVGDDVDVDRWVQDTDRFSLAHLKELFVSVVLLGHPYDVQLKTLRDMRTHEEARGRDRVGFGGSYV